MGPDSRTASASPRKLSTPKHSCREGEWRSPSTTHTDVCLAREVLSCASANPDRFIHMPNLVENHQAWRFASWQKKHPLDQFGLFFGANRGNPGSRPPRLRTFLRNVFCPINSVVSLARRSTSISCSYAIPPINLRATRFAVSIRVHKNSANGYCVDTFVTTVASVWTAIPLSHAVQQVLAFVPKRRVIAASGVRNEAHFVDGPRAKCLHIEVN